MVDDENSRNEFVIPQRRAGRRFSEIPSSQEIDGIILETAGGNQVAELPVRVNVKKVVPGVFRLPLQALVMAVSSVARIFRVKVVFGLRKDEP